jgi:serine/threonine protein kinase
LLLITFSDIKVPLFSYCKVGANMSLSIGTKLGSVEVLAVIGRGGMGEVYRARDTKLKRDVAIKTLPDEFSHDADRLNRFQREAEVLASLNHPNIAAIYDLQEADGARFLVLELVEGETLAERIQRGPIPLDEALQIAKSICEALEAAHEQGIVHRDLKPANIKITPDGKVKVLDFGLAKAMESAPATALSNSPTLLSVAASNVGVILGTAAYMSPEQAKGKLADRRADIWAFGVVLYEMLTGRMLFSGETVSETMAFVITKEPDWNLLPPNTPARVRELLRRCLTKDPRNRLQAIGEARIAIDGAQSGPEADTHTSLIASRPQNRMWMSVAAVSVLVAAAMAVPAARYLRETPPPEIRVEVSTPSTFDPGSFAISPDGRRLVFSAWNQGKTQLWVRPLDSLVAQPLAGTEGARLPFWSPDSVSIGFFADSKLKRIDIVSGARQVLTNAPNGQGGSWNREGTIVFAPTAIGGIFKVSATGGDPVAVIPSPAGLAAGSAGLAGTFVPQFLPDGRRFVFSQNGSAEQGIYLGSLDGAPPKRLTHADVAVVVSSGFLLFRRQATLFAQAIDFKRQELSGNPFAVTELGERTTGLSATAGIVAYRTGLGGDARQLTWLDRSGKSLGVVGGRDIALLMDIELAPDGKRVAVSRTVNGSREIWLIDIAGGVPTRFTFDAAADTGAAWSADGNRIVFGSARKGSYNLYWKQSSGAGPEELLLESDQTKVPNDWSPDGRFLLFRNTDPQTGYDLWVLPLFGDKKPFPFLKTPFNERDGQFSPDGKWIAYESNESGQFEIYVQPFSGPGGKFQISTNGGVQPRWNKNGKEIFYVSPDSKMMAVPVKLSADGQSLEAGASVVLFPVRIVSGLPNISRWQYAVSADGQRFLVNLATDEGTTSPITLILNWKPPKP